MPRGLGQGLPLLNNSGIILCPGCRGSNSQEDHSMIPLRTIVCGAGFWGSFWLKEVDCNPELSLVGIVARPLQAVEQAGQQYDLPSNVVFTDLDVAVKNVEADLAVVVTPPPCHLEHIQMAMQAGLHVICEKPLADNFEAAKKIASIVRARPKQKFMVSQTRRFTDQVKTMRDVIVSGKLGQLDTITFDHRVNYTGGGYRQQMDFPVVEDMICHHLDTLRYISGQEPVSVYTEGWNPPWSQFSGKASNNVLMNMTNGLHVNYFGTWTARGQLNDYDGIMKIMGSEGSLDLVDRETLNFYPRIGTDTGPNPDPVRIQLTKLEHREIAGVIQAFLRALKNNETPPCNIEDNLKTFAFNWAALESCRTNQRVYVQQI